MFLRLVRDKNNLQSKLVSVFLDNVNRGNCASFFHLFASFSTEPTGNILLLTHCLTKQNSFLQRLSSCNK